MKRGIRHIFKMAAALVTGLASSACTMETSETWEITVPYTLEVSGYVVDTYNKEKPEPVAGAAVNLLSYPSGNLDSPHGKASAITAKDGSFKISWTESEGGVHVLSVEGGVIGGTSYKTYEMTINLYSGSIVHDSSRNTYKLEDLVIVLEREL
ncbi:MAG: hypothetical protein ACI3ZC_06370 [Candidatus Cryptobacteroides sp.]